MTYDWMDESLSISSEARFNIVHEENWLKLIP
jgi:hypothetical protein